MNIQSQADRLIEKPWKNTGRIKEDEDQPWGPDWRPHPAQIAWFAQLLRRYGPRTVWGAPASGQIYLIDQQAKTFTLITGNSNDPEHWHDKNKLALAELGYTVLEDNMMPAIARFHGMTEEMFQRVPRQMQLMMCQAYFSAPPPPVNPDEQSFAEAVVEELLLESPMIATLEKHRIDLEPGERQQIMRAKAVWHHGKNGAESPAIHKAVVDGKTWWWSNTHRCGQVRPTLKGAIRAFHAIVEPSA